MENNSLNLVDMIRQHLTGDATERMSSYLGESSETTRAGIVAAIPAILAGLHRTALSPDGHRRIANVVDNSDDTMLDNPLGMFGTNTTGETGSGILRSMLGEGGFSDLHRSVGRHSGLSGTSTTAMLGLLVPVVFGVLKRLKRLAGSERFDIAGLLASQRENIRAAVPESIQPDTYEESTFRSGERERVTEAYGEPVNAGPPRHKSSWVLPVLLLAGAIGLLWYFTGRSHERAFAPPSTVHAGREEGALKSKYSSVIQEAQAQGVQISDLREEKGKLTIKGTAPSLEAANKVWNEIKRVNPSMDDIDVSLQIRSGTPMPSTERD